MTRVLSEGFELGDLVGYSGYTADVSATYKRSGAYGLLIENEGLVKDEHFYLPFTAIAEGYFRFGYYYVYGAATINRGSNIQWRNGSTILGSLIINYMTGGFIQINIPGVGTATGTTQIVVGGWYLIEVHIKIDDSVGVIEVKLDGVSEVTYSGDTKPDANTEFDNFYFYNDGYGGGASSTCISAIDDLALNDTAGGVDDSWCGDGKIIVIKPTADTATLDLTPSAAVDHYTLVDDVPADSDTTYVESAVDDEEDIYDLAACGLVDVTINRIWTEARAKDTATSGLKVALITKAAGGAEVSGGDVTLAGGYTVKVLGAQELVNPVDAAAWEIADIDALQAGPRKRS